MKVVGRAVKAGATQASGLLDDTAAGLGPIGISLDTNKSARFPAFGYTYICIYAHAYIFYIYYVKKINTPPAPINVFLLSNIYSLLYMYMHLCTYIFFQ